MKLDKVLCCMFLFFLDLDGAQNTIVVYSVLRNKPIEKCWLRNTCIVYESKTKLEIVHCRGPSNINLSIFVCRL